MTALLTPTEIRIRPFTRDDYIDIASIQNACFPEYAETAEEVQHYDEARESYIKANRYIAEIDGEPVAVASYSQRSSMYHPQKFHIDIAVRPDKQRKGIGTMLYNHLLRELEPFEPILLRAHGQEGRMGGPEFLASFGFYEEMRDWESRLKLPEFDPTPYDAALERVAEQGIMIRTLAELAQTDPDWKQKLFEMDWLVGLDMPATDERTKPTFEAFQKRTLENPAFLPEGWFVALDGDAFVGESALWRSQTTDDLFVGATGVLREYRRRGIAMALKIRAITFAKERGCPEMKTWNAQSNRPMLSINEALGFVKQPAWISFAKRLGNDE